jgi:hypothetical protein
MRATRNVTAPNFLFLTHNVNHTNILYLTDCLKYWLIFRVVPELTSTSQLVTSPQNEEVTMKYGDKEDQI